MVKWLLSLFTPAPVKISFSTHTVYPEINADVHGQPVGYVEARLYADVTAPGKTTKLGRNPVGTKVVEEFSGQYQTRNIAIEKARNWVQKKARNYLRV